MVQVPLLIAKSCTVAESVTVERHKMVVMGNRYDFVFELVPSFATSTPTRRGGVK